MSAVLLFNAWSTVPPVVPALPGEGFKDWTVRINGVDRSIKIAKRSLSYEHTRGSRGTMRFDIVDALTGAQAYRVPDLAEVTLDVAGERRFGGYVTDIGETPISGISGGTRQNVTVGDYSQIFDRVSYTGEHGTHLSPILNSVGGMLTTDGAHGIVTGDSVQIENHQSALPNLNGIFTATSIGPVNLTIPVTQIAPGGGGTVRKIIRMNQLIQQVHAAVLGPLGVVLDPALPEGPFLPPMSFKNAKVSEVFSHITTATGYVPRIDGNRVLSFALWGTKYAPFKFAAGTNVNGPVQVTKSYAQFANRIILEIGGQQKLATTQLFVVPQVPGPGGVTIYETQYPASQDINDPWPNQLIADGVPWGPISWGPDLASTFAWQWDYVNHRLIAYATGIPTPPPGAVINVGYTIQFPYPIIEEDPQSVQLPPLGKGPWEARLEAPTVVNIDQGRQIARNELRRRKSEPRRCGFGSHVAFALPGDKANIDIPRRLVSGDWMIETVRASLVAPKLFFYDYTFTEGVAVPQTWQESIRELTGTSGQSAGTIGGSLSVVTPSLPPTAPGAAAARVVYPLGVSWNVGERGAIGEWIPVGGRPIGDSGLQITIPTGGAYEAHVRMRAAGAGVGVRARIWDVTEGSQAGISGMVVSQEWQTEVFDVTIVAGHTYELHIQPDTSDEDVFATGYIQS